MTNVKPASTAEKYARDIQRCACYVCMDRKYLVQ